MRTILPILLVALPIGTFAQTYYYIDNISVAPAAPTTSDPITITVIGNLSSSNSYIVSASHSVTGSVVNITIVASASGVGLPVLVPHNESFAIGTLPAGTYSINITGMGTFDGAPSPEHLFIVTGGGGSPCDSLIVESVQWAPYSDTALLVHVFNNSTQLFDYPGWVLLDSGGDTLAVETVDLFGIAGESWHLLELHPGATLPVGPFTGTLHLWTFYFAQFECEFTWTGDLCPAGPCVEVYPEALTILSGLVATMPWTIHTSGGLTVANGTFELLPFVTVDPDTVCLPPGEYVLQVSGTAPDSSFQFHMSHTSWSPSSPSVVYSDTGAPNVQQFTLYAACIDSTNAIMEPSSHGDIEAIPTSEGIVVSRMDGSPLGDLALFSSDGRLIHRSVHRTARAYIPVRLKGTGIYLLRTNETAIRLLLNP